MSELLTRNVLEIEVATIADQYEQKAVVAMQATALEVQGDTPAAVRANDQLINLSREIGAAPTMTYEDLIFRNSFERGAYVLSPDPSQAQQEAGFYVGHSEIEAHLVDTIAALGGNEPETSLVYMGSAVQRLALLHRSLGAEAFAGFRPYFIGLNGYAGPSGLFSAAIPTIDLLVHGGENINPEERVRMERDLAVGLYPSHQSAMLARLLRSSGTVDLDPNVAQGMIGLLNDFRKVHHGSVRKLVPEALTSQATGSGGVADVGPYLAGKRIQEGR